MIRVQAAIAVCALVKSAHEVRSLARSPVCPRTETVPARMINEAYKLRGTEGSHGCFDICRRPFQESSVGRYLVSRSKSFTQEGTEYRSTPHWSSRRYGGRVRHPVP